VWLLRFPTNISGSAEERLSTLIAHFYEKVPSDSIFEPLFRNIDQAYSEHVTQSIVEVLGGPAENALNTATTSQRSAITGP
jgi:truncated hemoglobin YjbI